ncbi:MAG: hypothetical protein Q9168_000589 [Polycauliona sp. 1 TL-2023]
MDPSSTPPTIRNPLRILVLTISPSTPLPFLLEGSEISLTTPYYSSTVPIWHDTIPVDPAPLENWQDEWSAPEAREVIQSLGAWVVVVRKPAAGQPNDEAANDERSLIDIRNTLTAIHKIITHHQEAEETSYTTTDNDPLFLLIGMPQPLRPLLQMSNDEWEDLGLDCGGWQWIDSEANGKNEFGEKLGLDRLQEALEANEWDGGGDDFDMDAAGLEEELLGVRREGHENVLDDDIELERDDLVGLREAILGAGDASEEGEEDNENDAQVEELESMMLKMQAIKGSFSSRPIPSTP